MRSPAVRCVRGVGRRALLRVPLTTLALGLAFMGCSGHGAPPTQTLTSLFEGTRVDEARAASPELMVQAEAARDAAVEAEARGAADVADELATEARIWLAAALAVADTLSFERERGADQLAADVASHVALERQQEREAVVEADARARAGQLAEEAAARAFTHAEGYEPRGLRRDDPDTRALYRETALALLQRSAALLAAARVLGASADALAALDARHAELSRAPRAELVVGEADVLLRDAMALLGQARAALPVSESERASLFEAARERGLVASRTERGVELRGEPLVQGRASAQRQLAALVSAHPHGAVQVLVIGPASQRAAGRRRAATLRAALLANGVPAERVSVVELRVDVAEPSLALLLAAY